MNKRQDADSTNALNVLRARIDANDEEIHALNAARAAHAREIGEVKGLSQAADFDRPEREAQVLRRVVERN
jgi:chorismate mutase/prephenate dehydratase